MTLAGRTTCRHALIIYDVPHPLVKRQFLAAKPVADLQRIMLCI